MDNMPASVSLNQRFQQKDNVLDANIKDEIVMICLDRDSYYGMDAIGARVWQILATPHSLHEVCEELVREYEVTEATALTEVEVLLTDLLTNGLIKPIPVN